LNCRLSDLQSDTLPTELSKHTSTETIGFEPMILSDYSLANCCIHHSAMSPCFIIIFSFQVYFHLHSSFFFFFYHILLSLISFSFFSLLTPFLSYLTFTSYFLLFSTSLLFSSSLIHFSFVSFLLFFSYHTFSTSFLLSYFLILLFYLIHFRFSFSYQRISFISPRICFSYLILLLISLSIILSYLTLFISLLLSEAILLICLSYHTFLFHTLT
jgi:hypothetical protein